MANAAPQAPTSPAPEGRGLGSPGWALVLVACLVVPGALLAQPVPSENLGTGAAAAIQPSGAPSSSGQAEGTGFSTGAADGAAAALAQAVARFDRGEPDGAAAGFIAWLEARPDLGDQRGVLAVAYSRELGNRGAFDEAMAFLERYLASRRAAGQVDAMASLELGLLLVTQLRHAEAAPHLEAVPSGAGMIGDLARLNLGKAYRALGRLEEARSVYAGIDAGGVDVFAAAAGCEIDLALDGSVEARACLERARGVFGPHPAFDQTAALLAYLEGDAPRASELVEGLYAQGRPGARVTMLRPLLALARQGPEQALQALDAVDQVVVRGERDAQAAAFLARAGRLDSGAERYRAALERNGLFADPERAGRTLYWRAEVVSAFALAAEAARTEGRSGTGEPAPTPGSPPTPEAASAEASGCCSTAVGPPPARPVELAAAAIALVALRRRRPRAFPSPTLGHTPSRAPRLT